MMSGFPLFRSAIAICLIVLSLRPAAAQTPAAQKIRTQVNDLPIGGKMTVKTIDGRELHGNLQSIDPEGFSIREVDLHSVVTLRYDEVDRVQKDYGRKGFGGRRVSPRKSLIVGLIVIGGLLALVFVAVASDKS